MNIKSTLLLKLLPLITFISLLFPTTQIAKAATSAPVKAVSSTKKVLKKESHGGDYAAAPTAEAYIAAGGNKKSGSVKKLLVSEKTKKIEFFTFCGLIASFLLAPEIFFKRNKDEEFSNHEDETDNDIKEVETISPDLDFLKTISANTKEVDLFANNSEESNGQVESKQSHKSA